MTAVPSKLPTDARAPRVLRFPIFLAITLASPLAAAADPAAALEQLRQGYALKEAGRCADAIAHLLESERLDPRAKTLLNLADCESEEGDLASAQVHAIEARERARQENNPELLAIAEERLRAIADRLPRLTLSLAPGTPADAVVSRDGTALAPISLGIPLPTNPGMHTIVVRAPGRADKRFDVQLAQGAHETVEVGAGELRVVVPATTPAPSAALWWTPRNDIAVTLAVAGVAGVGVGSGFGVAAIESNHESNENGHCDGAKCDATGTQLRDSALRDATVSTVAIGAGAAVLASAIVVWATGRSSRDQEGGAARVHQGLLTRAVCAPEVGRNYVGLSLETSGW